MDAGLTSLLKSANRFAQARISETISIAQFVSGAVTVPANSYTCTQGESFMVDLGYETGGATLVEKGSVVINKDDLAYEPPRGTTVTFRGIGYRITIVDDLVATWDIHLIQLSD